MKNAVILLFGLIMPMPFCGTIGHNLPQQTLLAGIAPTTPKSPLPIKKSSKHHHINEVILAEGGYQNHPYDSANRGVGTKYGITPLTYEKHTGKPATVAAMKALSKEQAADIYLQIWNAANMDILPDDVAGCVFDFFINTPQTCLQVIDHITGIGSAAKNWGIDTATANAIMQTKDFKSKLHEARRQYFLYRAAKYNQSAWHSFYRKIGKKGNKQNAKFINGWLNRLEKKQ